MTQGYLIKQPNGSFKLEYQVLKRWDYLEVKLGNYWVNDAGRTVSKRILLNR
jgi:hypothetical protein